MEENTPSQSEEGKESGHGFQDNQVKDSDVVDDTETTFTSTKQRSNDFKLSRNKNQKRLTDTPSQQMVQILKENAGIRKRKYEEKNSIRPLQSRSTSILENLDDTDLFFF